MSTKVNEVREQLERELVLFSPDQRLRISILVEELAREVVLDELSKRVAKSLAT
jgi:hypothetical protein